MWTATDKDGKPRYLRRNGQVVILIKDKKMSNCEAVPEGYEVSKINGKLFCKPYPP